MELKFKNNSIEKYKSDPKDFFDKKGRSKPVFTSFKMGAKHKVLYSYSYPYEFDTSGPLGKSLGRNNSRKK